MSDTGDPTDPLDLIAETLDPTDVDDDLGRRMGKDAQRVWRGDLSEQRFYEKYHDEVLAEFGVDERPVGENR